MYLQIVRVGLIHVTTVHFRTIECSAVTQKKKAPNKSLTHEPSVIEISRGEYGEEGVDRETLWIDMALLYTKRPT